MKTLFVCRGNMFRSQVAEALFKHKYQNCGRATSTVLVHSCSPKVTFWKVENPDNFTKKLARELIEKIERLVSSINFIKF